MRFLYSVLLSIALPFIFLRLCWKSVRQPAYRHRLLERLGRYPFKLDRCIWVHAVSVGETLAAIPLVKALQTRYPGLAILITTMTPTGAAQVSALLGNTVKHAYLPYDLPGAVERFLNTMHPLAGIIMETELWPNLLAACSKKTIPVCLVNARLSEKSASRYRCVASLTAEMLNHLDKIAVQSQPDAQRLIALGAKADRLLVTGNMKFDLELPAALSTQSEALRTSLGNDRYIWIAASTHEGEEELVLAAHQILREKNAQALLILVPRHPQRFDAVAKLSEQFFVTKRRSLQHACTQETAVYLGDTMGELLLLYAAADVAFVGGSLVKRGGHNMLEPGALGKPILTGMHLFNFSEISELFLSGHALIQVTNASTLADELLMLMQNPRKCEQMGASARQIVAANRGALGKQLEMVTGLIKA